MPKPNEKAVGEKQSSPPKPPGWRKFEKLLKQVIKAPPLQKSNKVHT